MTRIMRDSTTAADIPVAGTQLAAGYVNGSYANLNELKVRFPLIPVVSIDVNGSRPDADARDWETGDKAGSLQQWVIDHNNHSGKKDAVVYCNRSTIPEVRQLTGTQILGRDYWLWVATLDGTATLPDMTGVVAVQDKGEAQTGGHYDESVVYSTWWHGTAPPPPPVHVIDGYLVTPGAAGGFAGRAVTSADGGKTWR